LKINKDEKKNGEGRNSRRLLLTTIAGSRERREKKMGGRAKAGKGEMILAP